MPAFMTKYTTSNLNGSTVKNAKAKDKLYRLRDGGGLFCEVLTTGAKVWRYNYRINGKQKTFTIGKYPDTSLSDARTSRDEAKMLVSSGIDPSQQKQINKKALTENTFQKIAEVWLKHQKPEWSAEHYRRTESYLTRDVYPFIGDRETKSILAPELIPIIMNVSDRGAVDAASRVKGFIQQVFDYAVVHGKAPRNPAKDINLQLILPKRVKKHFAAITDPIELGNLLRAIDGFQGSVVVRQALKLVPMVMVRPAELNNAEWTEFDLDAAMWTIPAKRRKLPMHVKRANKPEDEHLVSLSSQAVKILRETYQYTGINNGKYVFPSARGRSRPMSNNAIRVALRSMGFDNDTITAHGFRGVASTFLNTLGYRSEVIEAQLAHKESNQIRRAYNHADYLEERTIMLQDWADYLDSLQMSGDNIPINQRS